MTLKIKTGDIELEYSDEYSIITLDATNRIMLILDTLFKHQYISNKPPHILASEVFGELNNKQ